MPYLKTADGCRIYYELLGEGFGRPTITFVNGTLQTTVYWKPAAKELVHQYRLLVYDARGQGESDLGALPLSLQLHASDLKALLDETGIHLTAVVAISHGARVALALADQSPDRISRMVLCSISTRATFRARMIVRSWHEILQRHSLDAMVWAAVPHMFGRTYLRANERQLERIVKTLVRRNRTESLRAHLEALQNYPPLGALLKSLPFLVLVLTGADDPLVTTEGAEEIARICGGRHIELKGVGHSITAEAPGEFNRLISEFLSNTRS
ncbi:MAG: alpha/beta fold hydrolase [Desulfobacteraceae bacterium]|nr:MAG: alpha/beta fold hydrolase [Desulfobacteraceae bacterium]